MTLQVACESNTSNHSISNILVGIHSTPDANAAIPETMQPTSTDASSLPPAPTTGPDLGNQTTVSSGAVVDSTAMLNGTARSVDYSMF